MPVLQMSYSHWICSGQRVKSETKEPCSREGENIWPEKYRWVPALSKRAKLGVVCHVFAALGEW